MRGRPVSEFLLKMLLHRTPIRILFFCLLLRMSRGYLDLYMDEEETKKLLGVTYELFYVRKGILNTYALQFNLPIKQSIDTIHFKWQSLRKPPDPAMFYNMAIKVSNPRAMKTPELKNISKEGPVPTSLTRFAITLKCTGQVSANVDIRIQMNISIFSASNLTVLNIKRRKTCLKTDDFDPGSYDGDKSYVIVTDKDVNPLHNYSVLTVDTLKLNNLSSGSTDIFYIAVGVACAIILLIAFVVAGIYIRSQKSGNNAAMSDSSSFQALSHHSGQAFLRVDTPNNASVASGLPNLRRGLSPVTELNHEDVYSMLGEIRIERKRLSLEDILMEGTFGRIYTGYFIGEDENELESEQKVYIKTVTDQARPDQVQVMLRESLLLRDLHHPNVNPILGACMDNDEQPLLVFPYMNEGNLKKFLQKCKVSDVCSQSALNTQQLVYLAIQIIRGVQYLHKKKIIHKDVAARNCVIDSNLAVKLTDTALSRDLFPNDYHCLGDNENRPVKWMAMESLLERKFSTASDVWSFGVLLWELMTMGGQPYLDIDPFEMAAYLREGYRISQPVNCPDELFAVMACCWALSPDERPKFSQLLACLQDFYAALGRYI